MCHFITGIFSIDQRTGGGAREHLGKRRGNFRIKSGAKQHTCA